MLYYIMSGLNTRTNNDLCAIEQQTRDSIGDANYRLVVDAYVHPKFKSGPDAVCKEGSNAGCLMCNENVSATMNLGSVSFGTRVDLEDNLRGIKRIYTKCSNSKFTPCDFPSSNRIDGECTNTITFNPYLCERDIVPTNVKFPIFKGF